MAEVTNEDWKRTEEKGAGPDREDLRLVITIATDGEADSGRGWGG